MAWQDKIYVILSIEDITQDIIDECLQTSFGTLRKNLAETEAILKWLDRNGVPESIADLDPQPTQYSNTEIIALINDPLNGWIEAE